MIHIFWLYGELMLTNASRSTEKGLICLYLEFQLLVFAVFV